MMKKEDYFLFTFVRITMDSMTTKKSKKKGRKRNARGKAGRQRMRRRRMLVWGIVFVGVLVLAGAGFVGLVYVGAWGKLPDYEELRHIQNAEASVVLTEDGEVMGKYYIENRTNIHYKNLPEHAINALIATEDVRFYQAFGLCSFSCPRRAK